MKIILLRHGEPEVDLFSMRKQQLVPDDLNELVRDYALAGITRNSLPPTEAIDIAKMCNKVVCSNLQRSLDSAKALGIENIHMSEALFQESDLPYSNWKHPKLPLYSWLVIFRVLWFLGYSRNGESISSARKRAHVGSEKLKQIATESDSVLLVGHGFINRFIAKELLANGWCGPKSQGHQYWDYGIYQKNIVD